MWIQMNFTESAKDLCCPDAAAAVAPVAYTSILVKELRGMGLGELAVADLNHDGVLDVNDMTAYQQGSTFENARVRAKSAHSKRGTR